MMLSAADQSLWDTFTKTVKPLKKKTKIKTVYAKHPLYVRRSLTHLSNILDLHHMSLQEAFSVFNRFLKKHSELKSDKILVITGRGANDAGALKKEFPLWLENRSVQNKIKCFKKQNEGSFEIELRKKCG